MGRMLLLLLLCALAGQAMGALDDPAQRACWPWKGAKSDSPHKGVTHWVDRASADGTVLHLFDFDFTANPNLRLELYDQDEDDAKPFDNSVAFWANGVGQVTKRLNAAKQGTVVAAWNGLFFTADRWRGPQALAHHVAPVVLNGKVYYNVGAVRWMVGVQYIDGLPVFKTLHCPDRPTMAREFTYAAEGAQCLIRNGVPLKMQPYPGPLDTPRKQPVPSTPREAGHIPTVDHIRTTRTSMGWSKDNRHLYLLIVQEPDDEGSSIAAFENREKGTGGWMVADLQRFWKYFGAWGAVNIDGGVVTQLTYLRPDGNYHLLPPPGSPAINCAPTPPPSPAPRKGGR
ncbi:MAG: phosphodiester glycosidase family protein [Armatimonadota bacterium]